MGLLQSFSPFFSGVIRPLHKARTSIFVPIDAGHAPFSGKIIVIILQRLKKTQQSLVLLDYDQFVYFGILNILVSSGTRKGT